MPQQPRLTELRQPDLVGSSQTGQQIAGTRQQNQLREIQIQEAERAIDKRGQLSDLRGQAAGGDQSALKRLIARDPQAGQQFMQSLEAVNAMGDNEKSRKLNDIKHQLGFLQMSPDQVSWNKNKTFLINATGIDPGEFDPDKRKLMLEQSLLMNNKLSTAEQKDVIDIDDPVQASTILPSGVVQIVRKNSGKVETIEPTEANQMLIKEAEKWGAELQGLRAGERAEAKESTKAAAIAFKGLSSARKNIANMNEGIKLLQNGAKTGAVEGLLPSVRSASIKLDNLKGRLGLDVIGSVTFGALSEAELKFALDTALPTKLNEKELIKWMTEKRNAQMKVAANLEEAALFLGEPGNSIADFIKMKKESNVLPEGITEDDILTTMEANNMSRQQVLDRLRGQ